VEATAVICTRDRAESLRRTLTSLLDAASHVRTAWRLLVVDNGSTDHTAAVAASFGDRLPVRTVFEARPGLSNARNRAVAEAQSRYIVWTDDDVEVEPGWLAAYLRAFERHPRAAVFGGRALPRFDPPARPWMLANQDVLASMLSARDAPEWTSVDADRAPFGLNYAVRTEEQRRFPYDPALGVAPGRRRGGEETAVVRAMLDAGLEGVWVWDAIVFHVIPAHRQTTGYVFEFYRANGFDFPMVEGRGAGPELAGIPIRLIGTTARALARFGLRRLFTASSWVQPLVEYSRCRGTLDRLRSARPQR